MRQRLILLLLYFFVKNFKASSASDPFKLRIDKGALFCLKKFWMNQRNFASCIVILDNYHMIRHYKMRDKHQNADHFGKQN